MLWLMCESRISVCFSVSGSRRSEPGALGSVGFAGGLFFPAASDPGTAGGGTLVLVAGGTELGSFGVGGCGVGGLAYGVLGADAALHECEGCDHVDARAVDASCVECSDFVSAGQDASGEPISRPRSAGAVQL